MTKAIPRFKILSVLAIALCAIPFQAMALFAQPQPLENPGYYQCLIKANDVTADQTYMDENGYIGAFKLSVANAHTGGLCSNIVPAMGQQQFWKLCDFKGPVAKQFGITDDNSLRFGPNAINAQLAILKNLTDDFDKYIYQKKYDEQFGSVVNGVYITPEALRILLLAYGKNVTDEFMQEKIVKFSSGSNPYALGICVEQCLRKNGKRWNCSLKN